MANYPLVYKSSFVLRSGLDYSYNICPRESFQLILDEIYSHKLRYECSQDCPSERTDATRLGLVFIVLAIGVTFNLEIAPEDPAADRYYRLAKVCMSKGGVLGANSIPTIQTIVSTLGSESLRCHELIASPPVFTLLSI